MRTPCTAKELEAADIARSVIGDVGRWRAALYMVREALTAPTPRQSVAALYLLRAVLLAKMAR